MLIDAVYVTMRRVMYISDFSPLRFDCTPAGPFVSILVNAFGCRPVTIVGGLIVTAGMLTSVFAPSVSYLVVTLGFVTGACVHVCRAGALAARWQHTCTRHVPYMYPTCGTVVLIITCALMNALNFS